MASCCWSTDCCPVETRRYAAVLMLISNNRGLTIHPVSDHEELGLLGLLGSDAWITPAVSPGSLDSRHAGHLRSPADLVSEPC